MLICHYEIWFEKYHIRRDHSSLKSLRSGHRTYDIILIYLDDYVTFIMQLISNDKIFSV